MHDFAAPVRPPVSQGARPLPGNIRDQRAPQGYIQDLVATADGQQRFSLPEDLVDQYQLSVVALASIRSHADGPTHSGRQTVGVEPGLNIVTTRKQDAIG